VQAPPPSSAQPPYCPPYYQRPGSKGSKDYPIPASWKRIIFMTEWKLCTSKIMSVERWVGEVVGDSVKNNIYSNEYIHSGVDMVLRIWRSC
jgi:hypothetical protein